MEPNILPLPAKGKVARYILTSAQNNTRVHGRFFENLEAYAKFVDARIMVSRFTYNKSSYVSKKSTKPGRGPTVDDMADAWYDTKLDPYICDDPARHGSCQWQLAPGLVWCAEMNILPTAARPLSGLGTYTRLASGVFPHAKIAMQSIPVGTNDDPKFVYTTGTVTHRNYIQKKAGLKADFHHAYAALIVEVNSEGEWWARHLNCIGRGSFYDCPAGMDGLCYVDGGDVYDGERAEALNVGDLHASEADEDALEALWGKGGIVDTIKPKYQFLHDVFSMRSRSHHDFKSFGRMFEKFLDGVESVEKEVAVTAEVVKRALRPDCEVVIVNSNHDRHGERWLDEADYRRDLLNSEFFLEAQLDRLKSLRYARDNLKIGTKPRPWNFLEWALRRSQVQGVRILDQDASFVICRDKSGGIECGWHGDDGPNGSRGTTQSLLNVGRRVNKGHDHTAAILDGVYSAGACARRFSYQHGPTAHSVSHIITYPNGKRTILTVKNGRWRA